MSYVNRYADGRVARTVGLGVDPSPNVPTYVTSIIRDIEAKYPLNTDSIQKLMDAFSKVLTDEAKKEAMERAAVAAGFAVADIVLMFIPIIGQVVMAIITVAMAVINLGLKYTQTAFKNQADKIVSDTQNYLRTLAAQYSAQLLEYQGTIVEQEAPAAYQLAVSGASLQGLGTLGSNFFSKVVSAPVVAKAMRTAVVVPVFGMARSIGNAQHMIVQKASATLQKVPIPAVRILAGQVRKADNNAWGYLVGEEDKYVNFIKAGTGEAQLEKTQAAAAQAVAAAEIEFKRQYDIAIANSNSPQFRAALRNALAAIFRTDPTINSLMSQVVASVASGTAPSLNMSVQQPSKGLQAIPMVATGAAVAALLFLKK